MTYSKGAIEYTQITVNQSIKCCTTFHFLPLSVPFQRYYYLSVALEISASVNVQGFKITQQSHFLFGFQ